MALPNTITSLEELTPEQQTELKTKFPEVYNALAVVGTVATVTPSVNTPGGFLYSLDQANAEAAAEEEEEGGAEEGAADDTAPAVAEQDRGERGDIAPADFSFRPVSGDPQDSRGVGQAAASYGRGGFLDSLARGPATIWSAIKDIATGNLASNRASFTPEQLDAMLAEAAAGRQGNPGLATGGPGDDQGAVAPDTGGVTPGTGPSWSAGLSGAPAAAGAPITGGQGDAALAGGSATDTGFLDQAAKPAHNTLGDHLGAIGQGLLDYGKAGGWMGIAAKGALDAVRSGDYGPAPAFASVREARDMTGSLALTKRGGIYTPSVAGVAPSSVSPGKTPAAAAPKPSAPPPAGYSGLPGVGAGPGGGPGVGGGGNPGSSGGGNKGAAGRDWGGGDDR